MKRKNQILLLVHTNQAFDSMHFSYESLKFQEIRYRLLSLMDCLLLLISMISICALSFRWDLESNSYEIIFRNYLQKCKSSRL